MKTLPLLLSLLLVGAFAMAGPTGEPDYPARLKQISQIAGSTIKDNAELKRLLKESVEINESQAAEISTVKGQIGKLSEALSDTLKENKALKASNRKEFFRGFIGGVIGTLIVVALIHARSRKHPLAPAPAPSPEPDPSIPSARKPPRRKQRPAARR
jgi:hypothetical protein